MQLRSLDWRAISSLRLARSLMKTPPPACATPAAPPATPRRALYSHRSTTLHAYAAALPDVMCLSARDSVLPVVPMFHVNAWGIPYSAALTGCKVVFPGPALDGKSVYELIEAER